MERNWHSNDCYKQYGVDGSRCSIRKYMSEVEPFCPLMKDREKKSFQFEVKKPRGSERPLVWLTSFNLLICFLVYYRIWIRVKFLESSTYFVITWTQGCNKNQTDTFLLLVFLSKEKIIVRIFRQGGKLGFSRLIVLGNVLLGKNLVRDQSLLRTALEHWSANW